MLIDLHTHTSGISRCCKISAEDNILLAKELGFDGLAITNHYASYYFDEASYDDWIEKYIAEWAICRELGKRHSMRIFSGVEVTLEEDPRLHILLYGADEAFLRENRRLCDRPLAELYALCRAKGIAVVQAHPFRNGTTIQNTALLDGIEINCHPAYQNCYSGEILQAARAAGLAVTVGCDYHADSYRPLGGMFLPESVTDERALARYIRENDRFHLQIHSPTTEQVFETTYTRL